MEISIILLSYNHKKYIHQALESILMQKLDVSYELLIIDDGSIDGTQDIIRNYRKRFKCPARIYLKKSNQCSPTKNIYYIMSQARGKYIAVIEGDDYWTDEYKLQKQYNFLESNKKYSGCVTNFCTVNQESERIDNIIKWKTKSDRCYTMEDFKNMVYPGMTVTFFARNYFDVDLCKIFYQASNISGDMTWTMLVLMKGDIYQSEEITAAYRYVQQEGALNYNSINLNNRYKDYFVVRTWIRLERFMRKNYKSDFIVYPINGQVLQLASQIPLGATMKLLQESDRKSELLTLLITHKAFPIAPWAYEENMTKTYSNREKRWHCYKETKKKVIIFGAGVMTADYLDRYAWLKDILFLVDNDTDKQGTSFKGYLVKSPKELIRYREKAMVLICNLKYENEIIGQLEEMGIKEYYCYCSMMRNTIYAKLVRRIKSKGK